MRGARQDGWERRLTRLRDGRLPRHVAIIMDGNGRWALRRGLPRVAGHRASVEAVRDVVAACGELGIPYLTLYTFSTENWRRPREEIEALWELLVEHVDRELDRLSEHGVRVRAIGLLDELPPRVREAVRRAEEATRHHGRLTVVLALNYGGRRELADAARALARQAARGELDPERVDEGALAAHLYAPDLPDPDLVIRTSGEYRLSNFLLWQVAYSELWVTDVCWPDFRRTHLADALEAFQRRERRFGAAAGAAARGAQGEPG